MNAGPDFSRRAMTDGSGFVLGDYLPLVGAMLARAEREFGPCVWLDGWQIAGVVTFPGIEDPSVRRVPEYKVAAIVLGADAVIRGGDEALCQMAHEVVHCLHLGGALVSSTMLEEGAAMRFALADPDFANPGYGAWRRRLLGEQGHEHYAEALRAVERLLALDRGAIRKLRAHCPEWRAITPGMIRAVVPAVTAAQAEMLCETREMRPNYEYEAVMGFMAEQRAQVASS